MIPPPITTAYLVVYPKHFVGQALRRAFLCGEDSFTGKNFDHRKGWVIERLHELDKVFCIDICAYAVMSNHTHIVLRLNPEQTESLDDESLIKRWTQLYKCPVLLQRYLKGECNTAAEQDKIKEILDEWRNRIMSISWYMRPLNEHAGATKKITVQAVFMRAVHGPHPYGPAFGCSDLFLTNRWEGRFKSQALLDEVAVLTCMSYVDLNPIRAKMAQTPEESDYTAIQQRIRQWHKTKQAQDTLLTPVPKLMPLVKQHRDTHQHSIGFTLKDYIELVDWAGRSIRENKRGAIDGTHPPILQRLGIEPSAFIEHVQGKFKEDYPSAMGRLDKIQQACQQLKKCFIRGMSQSRLLYQT